MQVDYGKMKVAELKELAASRGIDVAGMKKGEMAATLASADRAAERRDGPVEVEAEVVENDLAVPGKTLEIDAGSLAGKIAEITDAIDELAKVKADMDAADDVIAEMGIEEVGICKKALTDAIKAADEKRLEFGRILRKPVELVNARCRELTLEAEELNGRYKAREREAEEERRADKKQELREHYEAYAGMLADVVPYDKLHDDRWLNKGCDIETAKEEVEAKVDKVASDWESLKALNLEFHADAEARFFDALDLGGAVAWAGKLAEDKRKIEAMKAELEPEPAVREPAQDAPPASAYEPEIVYERDAAPYEPEAACGGAACDGPAPAQPTQPVPAQAQEGKGRVIAEISALLEWYPLQKLGKLRDALRDMRGNAGVGEAKEVVIVVDAATQGQLIPLGKILGFVGVTGNFKTGSLAEIVQRENRRYAQMAQQGAYGYGGC